MKTDSHGRSGRASRPVRDPDLRVITTAVSKQNGNLTERVAELRDAVYLLRHCAQLTPHTVLKTLSEVDRAVADQVDKEFERRRVGLSLPLSPAELDLCTAVCGLYHQIAKAYLQLLPDDDPDDELAWAPDAACGAMRYFSKILLCVYQAYQNVPPGLWRRIHALHERACALGLQDEAALESSSGNTTLTCLYKRALLIGLSNPYRFPYRAIKLIDSYVRAHANETELARSVPRPTNECLFVVDPRLDRPAMPMLPRVRSDDSGRCLVLDTLEISAQLHQRIKCLSGDTEHNTDRTLAGFSQAEELETFKTLLTQWGFHPIRSAGRQQTSGRCELAVGLGAVSFVLNGSAPVAVFDEQTEVYAAGNVIKGSFGHQQFTQRTQFSVSNDWALTDESAHGARLVLTGAEHARSQIRVGELIAMRAGGGNEWKIGTVRWAKSRNGSTFEVGVYRIGETMKALPAVVKPVDLTSETTGVCTPALLLASPKDTSKKMLIVPKGVYQPEGAVLVKYEHRERVTRIRRLELSTRTFDYFAVQFDHTNRDESLRIRLPA